MVHLALGPALRRCAAALPLPGDFTGTGGADGRDFLARQRACRCGRLGVNGPHFKLVEIMNVR